MASGLVVLNASSATAGGNQKIHKSYVCKYVGTPGVDERLQTGQNPIWVDNHSLVGHPDVTFVGQEFKDAQGRSVVIVANTGKLSPEPSVSDCPSPQSPSPSPSMTPTVTPSESPSMTPTVTPSVSPSESIAPPVSQSPSVLGTETVKPRPHVPGAAPTVLGTQAVAGPTAVEAGLSTWPAQQPGSSTRTMLGSGLLGGGLLLLVSGGWLGLSRRKRGAHQV
ncbi:MAG: hypothetical protein ACXVWU_10835 [Nocardioides sp.]